MTCRYAWNELDSNIAVFGDENFAGRNSTRKSAVGGVAMWSGQFVKAWSKTMGVLALSIGDSELAAVVRAATEVMGLQSILNDFCLRGHVAIKSDAEGKFESAKMSGLENPSDAQTKYPAPEPLLRHSKAFNWALVGVEAITGETCT